MLFLMSVIGYSQAEQKIPNSVLRFEKEMKNNKHKLALDMLLKGSSLKKDLTSQDMAAMASQLKKDLGKYGTFFGIIPVAEQSFGSLKKSLYELSFSNLPYFLEIYWYQPKSSSQAQILQFVFIDQPDQMYAEWFTISKSKK